jgi:hypothetical protein
MVTMVTGICIPRFLLKTVYTPTALTPWKNFNKTLEESLVNTSQVFPRMSANTMKESVYVAGKGK